MLGGSSGSGGSSDILNNGFLGNGLSGIETNSGTSFDLSEFPSLGGGGAGSGSNGLAAALRQQQMFAQQQQVQQQMLKGGTGGSNLYRLAMTGANGNFSMTTEDFPALGAGGQPSASNGGGSTGLTASSLVSGNAQAVRGSNSGGSASGLYSEVESNATPQVEGASGLLGGSGLGNLGGLRGLQQSSSSSQQQRPTATSSAPGPSSSATPGSALSGDYGLLGLLSVIRMTDADRNALALGSDLTMLGLNLGSTEQIYSTFSSPWSESKTSQEPHFQVSIRRVSVNCRRL